MSSSNPRAAIRRAAVTIACVAPIVAAAQSQSTIYGVVDVFAASVKGSSRNTVVGDGAHTASRLGFRGVEDLGSGLRAFYTLEMGLGVDSGSIVAGGGFGRQSFVGLGSRDWGALQAGLQYTPMFFNLLPNATFGMNVEWAPIQVITRPNSQGAGMAAHPVSLRLPNMVRYTYGTLGPHPAPGLKVDIAFAPGEASTQRGDFKGAAVAYKGSAWMAGLSTQRMETGTGAAQQGHTFAHALSAGMHWGGLTVNANYILTGSSVAGTNDARHFVLGASYDFGSNSVLAEVAQRNVENSPNDARVIGLGFDHNLSKRTALYVRVMHVQNRAGAAIAMGNATVNPGSGDDGRSFALGIRHLF